MLPYANAAGRDGGQAQAETHQELVLSVVQAEGLARRGSRQPSRVVVAPAGTKPGAISRLSVSEQVVESLLLARVRDDRLPPVLPFPRRLIS